MQGDQVMRVVLILLLLCHISSSVRVAANAPPRFDLGGASEIVVRVREGPESLGKLLYHLKAEDTDGDALTFGCQEPVGPEFLRFESKGPREADVYLKKELDREVADSYTVFLTLTDGKLPNGHFIILPMLIIVEDINDNEPVFKPFRTTVSVREDAKSEIIETVEAVDRDAGPFGQVIYQLQDTDGDPEKTFEIETSGRKGVIRLVGSLDYERKSLYQLRILAIDLSNTGRRNTGTAALLVKVEDVEDQPPVFVVVPPVTRAPEDLPVNAPVLQVKAIDGDRGVNNPITYRITKGGSGLFGIDRTSGVVNVRGRLDREATDSRNGAFILEIQAEEVSTTQYPPPSVTTEVTIILTDVNDETPQFRSRHYSAEINENAQINAPLNFLGNGVPEIFDHDHGKNGTFKMYLEEDNGIFDVTPPLGVNEASFLIRVKKSEPLDYEKIKVLNFKIIAKEIVEISPKSGSADITVYIRDVNDNVPEFLQEIYRATIPENAKQGTTVAVIKAEDRDSGGFGTAGIRYTDIRGPITDKLHLDPLTGVVTVRTSNHGLDRETTSEYFVTIEARDNNGQGNRNTVQLRIKLDDINDNSPKFLREFYEARIDENEAAFSSPLVVRAEDKDLKGTNNSAVRYRIVNGDPGNNFTINPLSGEIAPRFPLDFEGITQQRGDVRKFTLTVQAFDLGIPSLHGDVLVIIYVHDKNDHSPIFQSVRYSKAIAENTTGGTSVLQVIAYDGDQSPSNSKIAYRIRSGAQDKFVIDADTGIISVSEGANLDPDRTSPKTSFYILEVLALDGGFGDDQKQSFVLVNISITDVNNKAPEFVTPQLVNVPESAPIGYFVTRVTATDRDDHPVLRYSIDYGLSEARNEDGTLVSLSEFNYEGLFDINGVDGTIKVMQPLDREKIEVMKLHLTVEDTAGMTPGQVATATLTIHFDDVNDNKPVFKKKYYKKAVPENAQMGVPVVTVVAEDADRNRTMYYTLEGPRDQVSLLSMDSQTGEVIVNNRIDREVFAWLNLTIRARDSGVPSLSSTASLFVQVLDENDNNPIFLEGPSEYLVPEDATVGQQVAQVLATDADEDDHGKITYLLDSSSTKGKFRVDRDSGSITVTEGLDREETSVYNLIVQAWDNYQYGFNTGESRKTFKQISIRVTDVNDEAPVFVKQQICAAITEFHRIGETIMMISASDADDSNTANGKVTFSIQSGNDYKLFDIQTMDSNTARVVTRSSMKGKVDNYTLAIQATDQGSPSLYTEAEFHVCVSDVNDHSPIFIKPAQNFSLRIPENATVGTTLVDVEAKDDDFGQNGEVRYKFKELPNGHWQAFAIDANTGTITLKQQLDREKQRVYVIRIEAYDMGQPTSLSADLELTVYVTDINDYAPEFTEDTYEVMFSENVAAGAETYRLISTVDKDEEDESQKPIPCYFIVGGNEAGRFQLDIFTHYIYTTEVLDREETPNYTLIVQASDDCFHVPSAIHHFDPRDNTVLQVRIGVRDVNDNSPRFLKRVFTGGVTTETEFGTEFMTVKAVDRDTGNNSVIRYHIAGPIRDTLSEGLEKLKSPPFLMNERTGTISLNFDPQKGMKGYFDFEIAANDTGGLADYARVFIYLLREDQRVRFVLRLTLGELREKLEQFRDVIGNITGAIVNVDHYRFHENEDGSVDIKKTDLYLHFVKKEDNSIMEVNTVLTLIDKNNEYLDELFKEFNVLYSEPSEVAYSGLSTEEQVRAWLIGVAVFLLVMLVLVISMCLTQRSRYERQLKAATATAFGSQDSALNRMDVPNTNQHSVEGSNPIWMHAYDNDWYKEDEEISGREAGKNRTLVRFSPAVLDISHRSLGTNSLDENAVEETTAPTDSSTSNNNSTDSNGSNNNPEFRRTLDGGFRNRKLISDAYRFTLHRPAPCNITIPESTEVQEQTDEDTQRENDLNRNYDKNVFAPSLKEVAPHITKLETSEL